MSEDKDIGSSDTPFGDAADQWLRQRSRTPAKEFSNDPNKEIVKSLYRLGTRVFETTGKIDWDDDHTDLRASRDGLNCVREDDGHPGFISFIPYHRGQRVNFNIELYNQEVDQIGLYSEDIFGIFQGFFREIPIYVVSLYAHNEDHEGHKWGAHTYSYALSASGECMRAFLKGPLRRSKPEYIKEINPGELEIVGAAMNILRGQLEKYSPTAAV